ncbi:GyrI-like domain-containing protein [Paenibacillus hamazuiensis]|uniref:GyrI-like domain-containing protein n=1 Tax=Paenibacillus hamazuiensis TaxID=2936508 RepID=UPI00200EC85D|nr:GyrI-like domain-containing protein [Paenibacillus hamazuiensis]
MKESRYSQRIYMNWKRYPAVWSDVLISPYYDQNESFVTYWACCEVESAPEDEGETGNGYPHPLPEGMHTITLPARTYAMVVCTNRTIGEGYRELHDWMKRMGYSKADRACSIEKFYIDESEGEGAAQSEERVEILIPIKPNPGEALVERIDAVFLPVRDLEESVAWYRDVFGFKLRWQNKRMAGLAVGPNCGFHLVKVRDWEPSEQYTPLNFATRDAEAARAKLKEKKVRLSDWRPGEPVRFDFWDNTGNIISLIQL